MLWLNHFRNNVLLQNAVASILLVVVVLVARAFALRAIRARENWEHEVRLRWFVQIRNISLFTLLLGMVFIWAAELRAFAFSFVALAVAFVIATKELILCVTGGILRSSDRPFSIGDRIEILHYRGDVVDQTLFTTTLLEIGPGQSSHQYTGRAVVLPNSVFLSSPIINETYTDDFVLHVFTLPMSLEDDWRAAETALLKSANEECRSFLEQARNYMKRLERVRGLDAPKVDPRVSLQFPEPGRVNLLVRIPAPARRKGRIEQAILRRFMQEYKGSFRTVGSSSSSAH